MSMNYLDYIIVIVLAYHAFKGFHRGLLRIVLDIVAIVSGIYFGIKLYPTFSTILESNFGIMAPYSSLLSFCGIWVCLFLLISVFSIVLDKAVTFTGLGIFNRIGGLVLGSARGLIILIPVILALMVFHHSAFESSKLLTAKSKPVLENILEKILANQDLIRLNKALPTVASRAEKK